MKHAFRKMIVFLLVLAIVLSMLPAVFAATGTLKANSGVRDQVCTELSGQAKAYYTGNYTYENLSTLKGASDVSTSYKATQGNSLYSTLYTLMSSTHTNQDVTYSGWKTNSLATYWEKTDAENGSDTFLYFYTDILYDDPSVSSLQMNREHVWPKSRASFYQTGGGADLHHLRPSVSGVNAAKSNNAFANLNGTGKAYQVNGKDIIWTGTKSGVGGVLEVRDNVKGDVARILLYVYVRWQQPNLYSEVDSAFLPPLDSDDVNNGGDNGQQVIESLDTLLQWMELDPVDAWEMGRNDQIENVQGNRNVFIDYPELAYLMFNQPIPKMQTPSGIANKIEPTEPTTPPTQPTAPPTQPTTPPTEPTEKPTQPTDPTSPVGEYYTITWCVENRVYRELCAKGSVPVFNGSTDKPDDDEYTYTFAGWSPRPVPATADATYIATYTAERIRPEGSFFVTWDVNGEEITEEYDAGTLPVFTGSTNKPDDSNFIYCFAGWSPAVEKVTEDVTYTALYNRLPLRNINDYLDVTEDMWCYDEVCRAAQIGLFNGVSYRRFDPEGDVSRAMVVTVLYRMEGEPEVEMKRCFEDVPTDRWYSRAVLWAYNEGIANGTSETTFAPNAPVTREQLSAFLYRYAQWRGYDIAGRERLTAFEDRNSASDYAVKSLSWAVGNGLLKGVERDETLWLLPRGTATRAQAASIMVRFFNSFIK